MADRCGEPTRRGTPCQLPADTCPHHDGSGLSHQKKRAAELLATGNYTRKEVAAQCGVHRRTLRRWEKQHEELQEAARRGDEAQYEEVVTSWIERLKEGDHSGAEMIFYLKNKRPDLWHDRKHLEHSGEVDAGGDTHIYLPDNSRDDLPEAVRDRISTNGGGG